MYLYRSNIFGIVGGWQWEPRVVVVVIAGCFELSTAEPAFHPEVLSIAEVVLQPPQHEPFPRGWKGWRGRR